MITTGIPTASVHGSPEQSHVVLNTVSLNKVELNNNVSSLRLTHSAMKMFAELNNLCQIYTPYQLDARQFDLVTVTFLIHHTSVAQDEIFSVDFQGC